MYRDRLRDYWIAEAPRLLRDTAPDAVVAETLPAVGSGNFVAATQSELAKLAFTIIELEALHQGIEVRRMAANTIKKNLTGNGRATKVKIRDAVLDLIPELLPRKKEFTIVADEVDAIATSIAGLGYKWKKPTKT